MQRPILWATQKTGDTSRLRFDQFKNPFDADALHPIQRDYFRFPHKLSEIANDPAKLADFYADIIATARRDFCADPADRTRTGIEMYSTSLQDLGFEKKQTKDLIPYIKALSASCQVMVVVGCQGRDLLRSRARAAARLFNSFVKAGKSNQITILFSGRHPPEDAVSTLNEAADLREFFEESFLDSSDGGIYDSLFEAGHVLLETESESTRQNIVKLFETIAGIGSEVASIDLFVVSNDFHLVRLSNDLREVT